MRKLSMIKWLNELVKLRFRNLVDKAHSVSYRNPTAKQSNKSFLKSQRLKNFLLQKH